MNTLRQGARALLMTVLGTVLLAAAVPAAQPGTPLKLLRFGPAGHERPGLLDKSGAIRDLSKLVPDITPAQLSPESMARLAAINPDSLPRVPAGQRLGVPIKGIGKIVAIGLNYAEHAREAGQELPTEPIVFLKATSALNGPNDDVVRPRGSSALDHEVELVIVIGRTARNIAAQDAGRYIAGYALGNDVSERDFQIKRAGQWTKGKSADTFAPLGPYVVAADAVAQDRLDIWLSVNGQERQHASTADMIFKPHYLVAYVSQFMTLNAGDVIYTGTPPGVGMSKTPAVYLQPGDIMTLGIEGLGEARQKVVAYERSAYATTRE